MPRAANRLSDPNRAPAQGGKNTKSRMGTQSCGIALGRLVVGRKAMNTRPLVDIGE